MGEKNCCGLSCKWVGFAAVPGVKGRGCQDNAMREGLKEVLRQGGPGGSSSSWPLSYWVPRCSLVLHSILPTQETSRARGQRHRTGQLPALCCIVCDSSHLLHCADGWRIIEPFLTWSWLPHYPPKFPVSCSILFQPGSQTPYSDPVHAGCSIVHLTDSYLSFKTYRYRQPFLVALLDP